SFKAYAEGLAISPRGDVIATYYPGRPTCLWETRTGQFVREIGIAAAGTESVAFSPDGKRLLSGGKAASLGLWDVETGKEVLPLVGHRHAVLALAFSPDGTLLASQGGDQTVRLWQVPRSIPLHTFSLANDCDYAFHQGVDWYRGPAFRLGFSP